MATRSDFAQKLLNDLRMRKERMAVSQSSGHSTRMAFSSSLMPAKLVRGEDVNGNRSQNYKGSRQIKTLESVGSRPANSQKRSSTRSIGIEESSRQLVPFGGGRNSEPIGDLSMALAFALENRGKIAILDSSGNSSMLSFLHHFGRRSLDVGKMERSNGFSMNQPSSRFPTLSHVHIKEISKGAQKLNQILRACSNGLNVDTYSIEIGRELLKGAMDLEESLRMLVNPSEASTLSRKQALNTSTSVSHKRSASCGPDYRALVAFSEPNHQTSSSQSKPSNKESEQPPTLYSCGEAEHQGPITMPIPTPNENCQEIASEPSTAPTGSQDQAPVFNEQEQKSWRALSSPVNGADEESIEISYLSQHEHKGILTPGMQEMLTENETNLKQTLIKSQRFLNVVEALFKLNTPISVLRVTDHTSQDEDSKFVLDCAFEVMKRKKRRQELTLHPYLNISIISIKISALDDLVKELHKDFENLKFYGGNGSNECNAADYLHKILERDVQNRDPDVNCMWELGWNEMMFAIVEREEVIREVERHLLNGLIDEITKDLLHLNVFLLKEE